MTVVRATRVAIIGAGRVGLCLAQMLAESSDYAVVAADCTDEALAAAQARGLTVRHVDAARPEELGRLLADADIAVAAVPDRLVPKVAQAAVVARVPYLDFCEPTDETRAAASAMPTTTALLTGCGVSPGLVDAVAYDLAQRLDPGCDLDLRVGAIPAQRTNRLGYGLIWSLDGLIDEYTAPCMTLIDGRITALPALSGRVEFVAGGVGYEAFLTSGSVGALTGMLRDRVRNLVFRTIRYPGHLDYMTFLLDDLGLRDRRDLLTTVLRNGLPQAGPEALVIEVRATGTRKGEDVTEVFSRRFEPQETGAGHGALALASAAHAAALIDLMRQQVLDGPALRHAALVPHDSIVNSRHFAALTQGR